MAEYHFPVPGSVDEKEIVVFVRRHFVAFLGQFLLSFVLLIIPVVILIIIYALNAEATFFRGIILNFIVLILSAYYLVAITFAFVSWISFYYNVYIVTNLEIIEITQVGFFGRKISQLSLLRVQDVTSDIKGFLPTFFAFGDVLVETAGEKESFLLCSIPNPQEVCSKIMALHDQVIEREGRHHQILEGEGVLAGGKISKEEPAAAGEAAVPAVEPEAESESETEAEPEVKTQYQELIEKEKSAPEALAKKEEGEISKDDLDKGGEIDLK